MAHANTRHQQRIGDQPWLRRLLIGLACFFVALLLVVPLFAIFAQALSAGLSVFWTNLSDTYTLHAIALTLFVAALTVPLNLIFGFLSGW